MVCVLILSSMSVLSVSSSVSRDGSSPVRASVEVTTSTMSRVASCLPETLTETPRRWSGQCCAHVAACRPRLLQHPRADLDDRSGLFGGGNEGVGCDETEART